MAADHVTVGISPEADIELAEALVELRRAGHRMSKRQLATVAVQRYILELRDAMQRGEGTALQTLLGQGNPSDEPQVLAA
jgi:hypothetical protein